MFKEAYGGSEDITSQSSEMPIQKHVAKNLVPDHALHCLMIPLFIVGSVGMLLAWPWLVRQPLTWTNGFLRNSLSSSISFVGSE